MKRTLLRFVGPVVGSALLFALYMFLLDEPIVVGRFGDIRELIFGKRERWLLFLAIVPVVLLIVRVIDALLFDVLMRRRGRAQAPHLLREIASIVLYFILFGWTSTVIFNVSIAGFLATGSVLAVVLGFALQDSLGNLFAGIALHLEDSFDTGDVIKSGDYLGIVEEIRWRGTRLRTFNNNIVILPNSIIARERIEVFPRENLNARVVTVGVDYHFPPATVIGVLVQAASHVEGVAHELPCIARVGEFGDSAVRYEIKYFTREYARRDSIDADIRKAVWYALRRNGMTIPYPIRTFARYEPPQGFPEPTLDNLEERLRQIDILSPLSDASRSTIAMAARVHHYSRGETILRFSAAGDSMFVVHEGTVSVRVPDAATGGRQEVAQLGSGSVFGEMALLTGEARTADVVAATDVVAIEIAKEALRPVLLDNPGLAAAISAKVAERRDHLGARRAAAADEQKSVLDRIRDYFGL